MREVLEKLWTHLMVDFITKLLVVAGKNTILIVSRLQKVDFVSFYFLSHFYFIFNLFFIFSIFRTLGLGLEVISHISHI